MGSSQRRPHSERERSSFIRLLRMMGRVLPGDRLKTAVYRTTIAWPRRALRQALGALYRIDLIYAALEEVRGYRGRFSILEFGTHKGYTFTKMLFATQYMGLADRVRVHAFDSFAGLPATADRRDQNLVTNDQVFVPGQYAGSYEQLESYCRARYHNYAIHQGYFEETLSPELLQIFGEELPILVWVDCDYYSSTRIVLERLLPYIPSGCLVYFDDLEYNYGSRFTGEARAIYELNQGAFGEGVELVVDRDLGMDSASVYRLIRFEGGPRYERVKPYVPRSGRARGNDSALP
jgi:Macrocin-O-methyltransferase (TylF)